MFRRPTCQLLLMLGLMIVFVSHTPSASAETVFTIDTVADSGPGSLRYAIEEANATLGADKIVFALPPNSTITLQSGSLPVINEELMIDGRGTSGITISGAHQYRILEIAPNVRVTLFNLTFTHGNSDEYGGAIQNNGDLMIRDSHFSENESTDGGAIFNNGNLTVIKSLFNNNPGFYGGAIANEGHLFITKSTFSHNGYGYSGWGGGVFNGGTATISHSTFHNNTALVGGAIDNLGSLTLRNSTLSTNFGIDGSGIYSEGGLTIRNSTLWANSLMPYSGVTHLYNSILASCEHGTIETAVNNIIENLSYSCHLTESMSSNNIIGQSPLLEPLADNGGLTWTHALSTTSPAINSGDHASCEEIDQRGMPRTEGGVCDRGAFEASN